jgi:PleD family two-component response regulator
VLRATDAGKAIQAARRIYAAVTRELFATATGKQRIDLAIGLASCSDTASSAESLLLAAERALGRAGQAGQMIVEA